MNLLLNTVNQASAGHVETTEEKLARLERENEQFRKEEVKRKEIEAESAQVEELIYKKTSKGLTRIQAIAVLERQKKCDKAIAEYYAQPTRRGPILKILKKHNCLSYDDVTMEIRLQLRVSISHVTVEEIKLALDFMKEQTAPAA